ncbi:MAG: DNA primase [Bacteroidetes bacterium]|nr:MAG: DNA primase [Bacteroidota bacterium]
MARIPAHIVDTILSTARIEEVIGEFVNLKRAGSNLKGLSPFTDEKTPSFMVSPAKQIFKCFSTGKGGTVVSFLMEKEHFSYPEALRWLANKYQIAVPEEEQTPEEKEEQSEKESLRIINEFAKSHFKQNLHEHQEGKTIGLSYFQERGYRLETIEKFELGYCLNSGKDLTEHALEKGYKLEYLEKVGLVKSKDDRHFDFFRGRVMFPIHSVTGRVLGFGGRILGNDKKTAKYFNSPESPIYNKSEILYGLYFAKGDIIKYDNCYLVEGYTDVISLYQAGISNVVSSSGTSLTREQIKLMRRYTQNITILYDGDAAGIKASFRGIDLILEEGLNVHVVLFPDGDDPDSYSKKVSTSELEDYIRENTKDFITFKAEMLLSEGTEDPSVRVKLIHDIVSSISLIPDQISRSVYAKEISERFEIDMNVVSQELASNRKKHLLESQRQTPANPDPVVQIRKEPIAQSTTSDKKKKEVYEEFDLIRIMIKYGAYAIEVDKQTEEGNFEPVETSVCELIVYELDRDELTFKNELYNRVYELVRNSLKESVVNKPSFFLRQEDPGIVRLATDIESDPYEISHNWLKQHNIDTKTELENLKVGVINAIYAFKTRRIADQIEILREQLLEAEKNKDNEQVEDLLAQQILLENVKMALANQLGRIILHG